MMTELSCLAELGWIGGALRAGGPDATAFVPVLRAYLGPAADSWRVLLSAGAARLPAAGASPGA